MAESKGAGKVGQARDRPRTEPALPAWKAFVVQFGRATGVEVGVYSGRVEHLSTGQRARFRSPAELIAFVDGVLRERTTPT